MKNQTIKIDIDGEIPDDFLWRIKSLCKVKGIKRARVDKYRTANGFHLYVCPQKGQRFFDYEIIIWQLLLGSDKNREFFNYQRVLHGDLNNWNVLFSKKFKAGKKVSSEEFMNSIIIKT